MAKLIETATGRELEEGDKVETYSGQECHITRIEPDKGRVWLMPLDDGDNGRGAFQIFPAQIAASFI